ncbi:MAG: I78 family peptidase inhibitor [Paracoccus sp. (in: a-proteobacteria)]|nr:I78 family peptidase inhibitor [Paracoccus sp. (in: a-proteobacteria)]
MNAKIPLLLAATGLLSACMPYNGPRLAWPYGPAAATQAQAATPAQPPVPVQPSYAPIDTAAGGSRLEEKQPDLCRASRFSHVIGQPADAVASLGITDSYRIVEFRGIEPQQYQPYRVNFHLDQQGLISRIECG